MNPKHYIVRLYVIRGINVAAKDDNGLSDPFLEVSLGRKVIRGKFFDPPRKKKKAQKKLLFLNLHFVVVDKESLRPRTINPEFHCFYELDCVLPGQSHLKVS
jgi:hypothetical protein